MAADGCATQRGIAAVLIREFHSENFKSLASLDLELGRVIEDDDLDPRRLQSPEAN